MDDKALEETIQKIRDDVHHLRLLSMLSSQIDPLLESGSPSISIFFDDLGATNLLLSTKLYELRKTFAEYHVS